MPQHRRDVRPRDGRRHGVLRAARGASSAPKVMREVERQVMLRIIDQRWREHLEEMDYLQEGINLRAMGQKDPLVEWQREGFEMFGAMMKGIAQDFVRYVMHVQVVRNGSAAAGAGAPAVQNVQTTSSRRPSRRRLPGRRGQRRVRQRRAAGPRRSTGGAVADGDPAGGRGQRGPRRRPSRRPSSRTSGRRRRATRRARAGRARSSRCATARPERRAGRADA